VAILISKYAGLETYGEFAIVWLGFFLLHALLTSFIGLPFLVLGNKADDINEYCKRNLQLLNMLSLLVWIMAVAVLFTLNCFHPNVVSPLNIFLIPTAIVLYVKHEQHRRYFFAKGSNKNALLIDTISYLMQVPAILLLGLSGELSLETIFVILVFFGFSSNLVFHLITKEFKLFGKIKELPIKQNWSYGKYLIATNLIQWTSSNFLLLSLGVILGTPAVGTVRLVQNLMGVLHVFFITIENVVPAKASFLLNRHSAAHFKTYFKQVIKKSSLLFGVIILTLWLLKAEILQVVYGIKFVENQDLFGWFIILYIFIFSGTLFQIYLKTTEANRSIFIAYLASLIASFLSSNYLIETYNLLGYVYGLMLFQLIGISIYLISIKRMNYGK
jgi:O-antigen/teichoic acid export membrane protein